LNIEHSSLIPCKSIPSQKITGIVVQFYTL
jgi:hypothetical protein